MDGIYTKVRVANTQSDMAEVMIRYSKDFFEVPAKLVPVRKFGLHINMQGRAYMMMASQTRDKKAICDNPHNTIISVTGPVEDIVSGIMKDFETKTEIETFRPSESIEIYFGTMLGMAYVMSYGRH